MSSTAASVLPLVIFLVLLGVALVVGFVVYNIAQDVAKKTSQKMEKKNMSFSKDGLKVGVKEVSAEQIGDSTQRVLMKTLNAQDRPAFHLRTSLSGHSVPTTSGTSGTSGAGADQRKSYSSSRGGSASTRSPR